MKNVAGVSGLSNNKFSLGKAIKRQRKKKGMTQTELSALSDTSLSYICRIELGQRLPSAKILRRIAEAMGSDLQEFLASAGYLAPTHEDKNRQHGAKA